MKVSDYIADFLCRKGITHVFGITGGASAHLIDSISEHPGLTFICTMHEQAAAMAADGFARMSGGMGCALATSGPGATNLITGICSAFFDSVPVLFLTGQVATFRLKADTGVRQVGFQETDILPMCKPVTKYSVQVTEPEQIQYELEKAMHIAKEGRPGPVLLDLPDDIQRQEVDLSRLSSFSIAASQSSGKEYSYERYLEILKNASRPVAILGSGVRIARAEEEAIRLIETTGIPFVYTWAAADIIEGNHPLCIGPFGTHGTRYGNFAVQNADFILSIGSRLDTKATGSPPSTFAPKATKIMVDIDRTELDKFNNSGLHIDHPIRCDAKAFLQNLLIHVDGSSNWDFTGWKRQIDEWKNKYPICLPKYFEEETVNPYVLFHQLSEFLPEGRVIVADTGNTLAWLMQSFRTKKDQRLFHDWNTTAMGWALPASLGICAANNSREVICITGDGSLLMNLQEMATVVQQQLPIKIILINNKGYGMIQQTQDQWFGGRYHASSVDGGLAFPDFADLALAFGYPLIQIKAQKDLSEGITKLLGTPGYCFCNVTVDLAQRVLPLVKFGRPNEDMEPLLDRQEFQKNMLKRSKPGSYDNE